MAENETAQQKRERYLALCHAMQTGVAMMIAKDVAKDCEPKHLRVGINTMMSDHGALVALLIKKGLLTEEEYYDALIESMQREVDAYEKRLSILMGATVRLH